jgi:hypothetical protein
MRGRTRPGEREELLAVEEKRKKKKKKKEKKKGGLQLHSLVLFKISTTYVKIDDS